MQEVVLGCIKSYDAERRRIFCRITRSTQHIVQTLRTARKLRENRRSRRARRRAPPEPQHRSLPYTWSVRQPWRRLLHFLFPHSYPGSTAIAPKLWGSDLSPMARFPFQAQDWSPWFRRVLIEEIFNGFKEGKQPKNSYWKNLKVLKSSLDCLPDCWRCPYGRWNHLIYLRKTKGRTSPMNGPLAWLVITGDETI